MKTLTRDEMKKVMGGVVVGPPCGNCQVDGCSTGYTCEEHACGMTADWACSKNPS